MAGFTSILSPYPETVVAADVAPSCFPDLHLDDIIAAVTGGHSDDHLENFFYAPLRDVSAVDYRHRVFRDLDRDQMRRAIQNFVDGMRTMRRRLDRAQHLWHPLQRQGWFVDAVEAYRAAVESLRDDLIRVEPASPGLRAFADHVNQYVDSDTFKALVADTQAVRAELRNVRYTVHIQGLRVHVDKFEGQGDYSNAVVATFDRFATEATKDYRVPLKDFPDMNHVEEQILERVAKLYPDVFALLDEYCRRNQHFVERTIARFDREIRFYLAYLAFVHRFTAAGLAFTFPEVTTETTAVDVDDAFDLALAIKSIDEDKPIVCNDFRLSGPERIFVVTGPNQGGKTTFARTIGQCAYLAALGCPIPARRAKLMLPDHIYTHFERQESLSTLHGKLDDELVRIHDILCRATEASIVIMNESFSSTTADDALLIGTEVLQRIIKLGCVAVYVTFLDELSTLDPACASMVGEVARDDPTRRTFKFTRRPADGLAYAAALADKYALNPEVLRQRIGR
ncbi:MutS-related protein [Mycobacterium xenopi]|uniref:DNA mismatch repair protein MutS n=3 Tax=Mycobacterium xenopi TaxID=1789 RepID=A0AAD1H2B3_MYCXE|nr:DNA mismatch repair protein MutS [Mycobacterium xenopi]MDA3657680.1 DNA mismatch repair protein MutS [Mycobacterium xenopi]MDA3664830.1 DNA mismatch repair protein MutS [Mycobacterium xenopi]ORX21353.1 DNA mismatch repair protein MutS [Mycobacterium xenopi]SPX89161.1 DNA mismatch repair protein mutS [Mycobacterium xenopi]BBU23521.1 DNA mismatch repair protein MutS [Mycobacterium xenopi]